MDLLQFVRGCTFDDFLLTPQLGVVPSRNPAVIDLTSRYSEHVTLRRPLVSANMDTITRAAMAVGLAEEGGIGVIDRGYRAGDIEPQVTEISTVKRTQHGVIADPHTIGEDRLVADAPGLHVVPALRDLRDPLLEVLQLLLELSDAPLEV